MPVVHIDIECIGPRWHAEYEGGRPLRRHNFNAEHLHELLHLIWDKFSADYPELTPDAIAEAKAAAALRAEATRAEAQRIVDAAAAAAAAAEADGQNGQNGSDATTNSSTSNEGEKSDNGSNPASPPQAGDAALPVGVLLTDAVSKVLIATQLATDEKHAANLLKNGGVKINGAPLRRDEFKAEDFDADGAAVLVRSAKKDAPPVHLHLLSPPAAG